MTARPRCLGVYLEDQRVGWLLERNGRVGMRLDPDYRTRADRRIFSLSLEDRALADMRAVPGLPPWFANLLFEGQLRRWIEASEEMERHDLSFLARIGHDLLGGVVLSVEDIDGPGLPTSDVDRALRDRPLGGKLRWSLAGVQLKLNLRPDADHFALPVHGELGCFIAKFADGVHQRVPEVEHATMAWGTAAGLDVAPTRLIDVAQIRDLPYGMDGRGEPVLLVGRFDRNDSGTARIHAEEFAQALGLAPKEKYSRFGWRHHLKLVQLTCPQDVAEYLRRLLFVVITGNADAHHKNFSFVFPDGRHARLAPAYDQVATVVWTMGASDLKDNLPFKLGGSRRFELVSTRSFQHLLRAAKVPSFEDSGRVWTEESLPEWVVRQVQRLLDTRTVADRLGGPLLKDALDRHLARLPLVREAARAR